MAKPRGSRYDVAIGIGFALLGVNIVGADPADVVIPIVLCVGLLTGAITTVGISVPRSLKVLIGAFSVAYVMSAIVGGYQLSFIANVISNCMLGALLLLYINSTAAMDRLLIYGVLGIAASGLLSVVMSLTGWHPSMMFDVIRDDRFMGLTGDPNILAMYSILFVIWLLDEIVAPRISARRIWLPVALFVLLVLQTVLTQSRSGWLGLLGAIATYVYFALQTTGRSRALRLVVAMVALGICFVVVIKTSDYAESLSTRAASFVEHDSAAEEERFSFFYTLAALGIAITNPAGVGPGMTSDATGITSLDGDPIGAHNAFVQIASDNGWLAFVCMAGLAMLICVNAYRRAAQNASTFGLSSRVVVAALIGQCIVAMTQDLMQWRMAWIVPTLGAIPLLRETRHTDGSECSREVS